MRETDQHDGEREEKRGWLIVAAVAFLFLCWGLFLFFTVGDKGPPAWDFGVVQDIPGQSPYATERNLAIEPRPQHVDR